MGRTTWTDWRVTYTSFDGHITFTTRDFRATDADAAIAAAIHAGHIGKNHRAEVVGPRFGLTEALAEMEQIDLAREAEDEMGRVAEGAA